MTDRKEDFHPVIQQCDFCEMRYDIEYMRFHKTDEDESMCEYCLKPFNYVECDNCCIVFEKREDMMCTRCGHFLGEEESNG